MPINPGLTIRPADPAELPRLQEIRASAFAPAFASFRAILGEDIYALAQAREDSAQAELLPAMFEAGTEWVLYLAEEDAEIVGFVSVRYDAERLIGEIGLNAVDPVKTGRGIGTAMYLFALEQMRAAGMRVATVGAGADPSHASALRAYEKAGFTVGIPSKWLCQLL